MQRNDPANYKTRGGSKEARKKGWHSGYGKRKGTANTRMPEKICVDEATTLGAVGVGVDANISKNDVVKGELGTRTPAMKLRASEVFSL